VIGQNFPSLEHIIVDGGSTDGTLDRIRRYPQIRLVVKPDRNLYEAVNTGILEARGEIIGLLNSDDLYEGGSITAVAKLFEADQDLDLVSGRASIFEEGPDRKRTTIRQFIGPNQIDPTLSQFITSEPILNARFIRKRVYTRLGLFDSHYRISSDRDFMLRLTLSHPKYVRYDGFVYHYRKHSGSLSMSQSAANWDPPVIEDIEIAEKYSRSSDTPFLARLLLRAWLTKIVWRGVRESARHKTSKRLRHYLASAAKCAPLWLPALFLYLYSKIDRIEAPLGS
jgi:glycosyltransferase involved in cell wall biosynthesis